jgi:hypothetical protein
LGKTGILDQRRCQNPEGHQNMLPKICLFSIKIIFGLEAMKQQIRKMLPLLPLVCVMTGYKFSCTEANLKSLAWKESANELPSLSSHPHPAFSFPHNLLFLVEYLFGLFETRSNYAAQAGLELKILLPQLPKCWHYWLVTPCPVLVEKLYIPDF